MIYRRRRVRSTVSGGFYRFEASNRKIFGSGDGDLIRLRDDEGNEWRGTAEKMGDQTVRYRFRDSQGNVVSGISDGHGILLRDESGNVWRGFLD